MQISAISLLIQLCCNVVLKILCLSKHIQSALSGFINSKSSSFLIIHLFLHCELFQTFDMIAICFHQCFTLLLPIHGRLSQTLLINLSVEWLSLFLLFFEFRLMFLLLLVLLRFILKGVLVKDLIFFLASIESVSVTSIVFKFLNNRCFGIICPDCLIFDHDLIAFALFDESVILVVSDLAFFTSLKFLPSFLFYHGSVCIQVLSLKSNFFQFLGKACFFISLLFLFLINLAMCLEETLLSCCLRFRSQSFSCSVFTVPSLIILLLSTNSGIFNLFRFLDQLLCFLFFAREISLSFECNLLFSFPFIPFQSFSQLSN